MANFLKLWWKTKIGKAGISLFSFGTVKTLYDIFTFALDFPSRKHQFMDWVHIPSLHIPNVSPWAVNSGILIGSVLLLLWDSRRTKSHGRDDSGDVGRSLPERISDLSRELIAFLAEQGPEPTIEKLGKEGFFAETAKRIPITHSGYMRRFHPKVESIIYEAGELGVNNFPLNAEVNREAHSSLNIRDIAVKLKELSIEVASHQHPLQALSDNDPVIVPEFIDKPMPFPAKEHFVGERPITLHNRGRSDAYDVQIADIVLIEGTAMFPQIAFIRGGGETKVRAKIAETNGELFAVHDLELLLETEWTYHGDKNLSGLDTEVKIIYTDKTRTVEFVTQFTMKFDRQLTTALNIRHGKRPMLRQ
jgi:hypothetical protein